MPENQCFIVSLQLNWKNFKKTKKFVVVTKLKEVVIFSSNIMLAFKSVKEILQFMGLLLPANLQFHYIKNVIITIPIILLLYSLCAYFFYNLNNLVNATDVFYVIAASLLCFGQYWFLVVQKDSLGEMLSTLQTLIDQSKFGLNEFYLQAIFIWGLFMLKYSRRTWITCISMLCRCWNENFWIYQTNESICFNLFINMFSFTHSLCIIPFRWWSIYKRWLVFAIQSKVRI